MTAKEFLNNILNGHEDVLAKFIELLKKMDTEYCIIGGLAMNAYVEPPWSVWIWILLLFHKKWMVFLNMQKIFLK